ncbi:HalOD1 output domain-containing protein [Halobacteriales archaeon Cl-PHB]
MRHGSELLTAEIVHTIADEADVDPADLEFQLHDYVATDALEALASHDGTEWSARFVVDDYVVTVDADQTVTVE